MGVVKRPFLIQLIVSCYSNAFTRSFIPLKRCRHWLHVSSHLASARVPFSSLSHSPHTKENKLATAKQHIQVSPSLSLEESMEYCETILLQSGDEEASSSAKYLVAHAIGEKGSEAVLTLRKLMATQKRKLSSLPNSIGSDVAMKLTNTLRRKAEREPLQYILGEWDFHELSSIEVVPPVLIPRPETEELVDHVIERAERLLNKRSKNKLVEECRNTLYGSDGRGGGTIKERGKNEIRLQEERPLRILDIGTGSGAVGIAILKALNKNNKNIQALVVGVEPNEVAHALSIRNAQKFNVSSSYQCFHGTFSDFMNKRLLGKPISSLSNIMTSTFKKESHNDNSFSEQFDPFNKDHKFDLIVSNPPYIPKKDMLSLQPEVVNYEDHKALCGGEDRLDLILDVIEASPSLLNALSPDSQQLLYQLGKDTTGGSLISVETGDVKLKSSDGSGANLWFEVDTTHPALLKRWMQSSSSSTPPPPLNQSMENVFHNQRVAPKGVEFVSSHKDVFGNKRFCSFKV